MLFLVKIFVCNFTYGQTFLRGIVKLNSKNGSPLKGVRISSIGGNTTYSNSIGFFEVSFPGKRPGMSVELNVHKRGYELINENEVDACKLRYNPDELIYIILTEEGKRDSNAAKYYEIIIENLVRDYFYKNKELLEELANTPIDSKERYKLQEQISDLQKNTIRLENSVQSLAERLAETDLDRSSTLIKEAFILFEKGKIKEAIEILSDQKLSENLKLAQEQRVKTDIAVSKSIENYIIKARFCKAAGQYEGALRNYFKAIDADSTNVDYLWELADYFSEQQDHKAAIEHFTIALRMTSSTIIKAAIKLNIATQYARNNEEVKSEMLYKEVLSIYVKLNESNPTEYLSDIAITKNNLGLLYVSLEEYDKAKELYLEALDIYHKLFKTNVSIYLPEIAMIQNNLGIVYTELKNKKDAQKAYNEALLVYKKLIKSDPLSFSSYLATTQNNMGVIYRSNKEYNKAEQSYIEALKIRRSIAKINPLRYSLDVATTLHNLGILYRSTKKFSESEEVYKEAIVIKRRLIDLQSSHLELSLCQTLLSFAYLRKNQLEQSFDLLYQQQGLILIDEVKSILSNNRFNISIIRNLNEHVEYLLRYFSRINYARDSPERSIVSIDSLKQLVEFSSNFNSKIAYQIQIIEFLVALSTLDNSFKKALSKEYAILGWYHLNIMQLDDAEQASRESLRLNNKEISAEVTLILILLFQERIDAAKEVFEDIESRSEKDSSFKKIFLKRVITLGTAGLKCLGVEKFKKEVGLISEGYLDFEEE